MATHSSIFAWKTPWTEEPDGLQFMGSQKVRTECTCAHMCTHTCVWTHTHTHTHTHCFSVRKADGGPVIIPLVLLQYRGAPMNGRVYQRSSWVRAIFVFTVTILFLFFFNSSTHSVNEGSNCPLPPPRKKEKTVSMTDCFCTQILS